jgi:hypothetical protein
MPPRTRKVRQARTPNQALNGSNNASLEESTHASIVDQVHVEAQVIINPTHPQNNPNSMSNNTITSDINHSLIKPRKTYLPHP